MKLTKREVKYTKDLPFSSLFYREATGKMLPVKVPVIPRFLWHSVVCVFFELVNLKTFFFSSFTRCLLSTGTRQLIAERGFKDFLSRYTRE